MQLRRPSHLGLIFILGLISMLTPLAIDMYLPALPTIANEFGVGDGHVQMTLSTYVLGFAIGQMFYGPMADSLGRKPVILGGTLVFAFAGVACALAQTVEQLIYMRFLHGVSAAASAVVINALMRDMFSRDDFSRMMSFVVLVMTVAPLIAPIAGGWLLLWFSWHSIFWAISGAAFLASALIFFFIKETLPPAKQQKFHLRTTIGNFAILFRHKRVFSYMVASGLSFCGMFSFLSAGPFVYINLYGVSPQNFGYYFALNVIFLFVVTLFNSRNVRRLGAMAMFRTGLVIQFAMGIWLVIVCLFDLGFLPLVFGVALFVGCIAMVASNAMAVILDDFPHMAGTASSLAGTLRFGLGAIVGVILSLASFNSAWPMVLSMALCSIGAFLLYLYAHRSASS
ncbi:Bcr/CflA family multidrug efflux MFS transporter [Pectobacterium punjabense]|uniref:Bcr/CflA family multidrug efflux MFS transporter n=1 Tax=Pectobacterium punjabense TaxID=2108399 RepID=UPI001968E675|nr:Bcr/CflA family multidrug efflux MFS transporter [Pectobacterium punjabense]MBN3136959.1 Bcr/CflA family multidrug efflux MFS transporter [Pectobacterium punjabense]MCE5379216.1 Bcr/CflA family multidrug efflux MFS transporter [Pectobacterium punjabense]